MITSLILVLALSGQPAPPVERNTPPVVQEDTFRYVPRHNWYGRPHWHYYNGRWIMFPPPPYYGYPYYGYPYYGYPWYYRNPYYRVPAPPRRPNVPHMPPAR